MRLKTKTVLAVVVLAGGTRLAGGQSSAPDAAAKGPAGSAQVATASAVKTEATPAMWKVQGAHETVYLFGTVHVMKPEVQWQTAKVNEAFKASDALYLELGKVDDMAAVQPMVMELGMDQAHPLSTKVSKEDVGLLDGAAKSMGLPGEQVFEPMQPWMAYMTLQVLPMIKAGYSPQSGIDMKLIADAKAANKTVLGFETVGQQLHFLADFPLDQQVELLHQELVDLPKAPAETDAMVGAWMAGDVDKIGAIENGEFQVKYPEIYKRLLIDRNARWLEQLTTLLKSDKAGTAFVAVGAAHLAGQDSLQRGLEAKGFKVGRVE